MNASDRSDIVAALDVGSNSVRLLVAEARGGILLPIFHDRVSSRLYAGLSEGMIHPDSMRRTARAIEDLAREARERGATRVWAFGTSAMRDGRNSFELVDQAARVGVELFTLSGDEEAELSFSGAALPGRAGMIDIGGGSTELLVGEHSRVLGSASAQLGAVRLCDSMRGCATDISAMLAASRAALSGAWERVRGIPAREWAGLGGTITTLAAMELGLFQYDADKIERQPVSRESARGWLGRLCEMDVLARKRVPGMHPARADIMPFGIAILCAFFDLSGVASVIASDRDNLIGFLKKKMSGTLDIPSEMR